MLAASTLVVFTLIAPARAPSIAWDFAGHRAVAHIAWEHMTPGARRNAVAILNGASAAMHFERRMRPGSAPRSATYTPGCAAADGHRRPRSRMSAYYPSSPARSSYHGWLKLRRIAARIAGEPAREPE